MLRDDDLWKDQEISKRAAAVLDARKAKKELELYEKLYRSKYFHASAKVVGTLSNRMAGDNDLNAQGINKSKIFRGCFPLAYEDMVLCGGDFSAFEVALGDAVFDDPKMREVLQTGRKIHAIFGTYCYPGMTYEEILATDGTSNDLYTRAKSGFFASILYGGDAGTLKRKLGIELENAQQGIDRMLGEFKNVGACIRGTFSDFQSLSQVAGIGSKIIYTEPADYVETKLGFRRYFTLENTVIKILFELAQDLPDRIRRAAKDIRVIRNFQQGREQSGDGACMTALYAAAFGLQGFVQRAANNHKIQAFGAELTKRLQVAIWDHQPDGENYWIVQPMNIHDEIMCPVVPERAEAVKTTVETFIEEYKELVPCLGMKWKTNLANWASK
jgi:DNA polymerase I-like protein with 3'-5' exonuclease and polymerase domains